MKVLYRISEESHSKSNLPMWIAKFNGRLAYPDFLKVKGDVEKAFPGAYYSRFVKAFLFMKDDFPENPLEKLNSFGHDFQFEETDSGGKPNLKPRKITLAESHENKTVRKDVLLRAIKGGELSFRIYRKGAWEGDWTDANTEEILTEVNKTGINRGKRRVTVDGLDGVFYVKFLRFRFLYSDTLPESTPDKEEPIQKIISEEVSPATKAGATHDNPVVQKLLNMYFAEVDPVDGLRELHRGIYLLAGPSQKDLRQEIMTSLVGKKVSKSKSGIHAIYDAIKALIKVPESGGQYWRFMGDRGIGISDHIGRQISQGEFVSSSIKVIFPDGVEYIMDKFGAFPATAADYIVYGKLVDEAISLIRKTELKKDPENKRVKKPEKVINRSLPIDAIELKMESIGLKPKEGEGKFIASNESWKLTKKEFEERGKNEYVFLNAGMMKSHTRDVALAYYDGLFEESITKGEMPVRRAVEIIQSANINIDPDSMDEMNRWEAMYRVDKFIAA